MANFAWRYRLWFKLYHYIIKGSKWKQLLRLSGAIALCVVTAVANAALPKEGYKVTQIASGLQSPWSMVTLEDGTWLITERNGFVVVIKEGHVSRVKLPLPDLYVAGQGGLLDIVLAPDFATSGAVFVSYAQGQLTANRLVVAKLTFDGEQFTNVDIVYRVQTDKRTPQHYAGRLLILPDSTMLITSGDGFDHREQAQILESQLGKVLRINLDGSIPNDNPYASHDNKAARAIFTLGHRNPQGLVYDEDQQQIVSHEHGPAGGDELNILTVGNNYGWPVITYGRDYSRARISPFTEYPGMLKPTINWTPSIAPSGMAYYGTSLTQFASLQQHVILTTLVDKRLYAVNLADGQYRQFELAPEITGRLRDVLVTKSGEIAVLTDGTNAELLLISAN